MQKIKLNYLYDNSVAQIILDDGKGNVLDKIMCIELYETLNSFQNLNNVKAIIFEGAGKHFSFGASVEEHRKEKSREMLKNFHSIFYTIASLGIPTIAKISGQCLGGGMELALICNFLFADRTAKLGQPEINLGVFPPPASLILPLKIGNSKAEELLITGKSITAEEAEKLNIVHSIFDTRELMSEGVNTFIEKYILPKSAVSLRYAVKASRNMFNHILTQRLQLLENLYIEGLMETHDANEGINSFLEKRTPVWKNR